jgi:Fe-S-cluster containining protein
MNNFSLDLDKYGLGHLTEQQYLTDEDIEKLIGAFLAENLSPKLSGVKFSRDSVNMLLKLSKCRRCGKCCSPDICNTNNPGFIIDNADLEIISKKTRHKLESLYRIAKVNNNPLYTVGARYLPLPCIFFNKTGQACKIYSYRPFVCTIFPILYDGSDECIVDLGCDFGKDIYRKLARSLRDSKKESTNL